MIPWVKLPRLLLLLFSLFLCTIPFEAPAPVEPSAASRPLAHPTAVYTLPAARLQLAQDLYRARTLLHFAGAAWSILQLLLLLLLRIPPRLRDVAVRTSRFRWAQGLLFTFLLLLLLFVLDLPLAVYGHHLGLRYGLSVQAWGGWMEDRAKGFGLDWGATAVGAMLLFWIIRRSPQRWWLWFWFPAMAAVVFGVWVAPVVIDPLFNRFEPLAAHDPALVVRLEQIASRGGLRVPPERMFLMQAAAKSTELNAYVTGIGPTKRVVVWDTAVAQASPDEVSFIFGHEMGHYILNHIYRTLVFVAALIFVAFWIGFHAARFLLGRYGAAWAIGSENDWAALAVYVLVLAALSVASEPIANSFSRAQEHVADIYGQEVLHGIVADPQAVAVHAFQTLGETSLDDPSPHPLVEFWTASHPSIQERATFAAGYDPWVPGGRPRFFDSIAPGSIIQR